jgi:hypothetical protein
VRDPRSSHVSWWRAPEWIFALFATLGGLMLIALIPPLAGGNEQLNFQRVAGIVAGELLIAPVALPGGIAGLLEITNRRFPEGAKPPYHYSRADFERVASLDLGADRPRRVQPSPIAVLHPVSYLPQVVAVAIGERAGLKPLVLFYVGRVTGLIAAILLTFGAIRIAPAYKFSFAAVALLPPVLFSRSTLDADQLTNGLAFLFLALVFREMAANGPVRPARIAAMALVAFFFAQAKSAYLLLPLLAFAIPERRFASPHARMRACALIALPGILATAAWMVLIKLTYFDAARYRTWSGVVDPHAQFALIMSHPLGFAMTLLRTIFATPFLPKIMVDFLGVFGPPVTMPVLFFPALAILLAGALLSDAPASHGVLRSPATRVLALAIAALTIVIILTLLYLQWTAYRARVVQGFNGRYIYPLAPLAFLVVPAAGRPVLGLCAAKWVAMLGALSLCGTCWVTWQTYFA